MIPKILGRTIQLPTSQIISKREKLVRHLLENLISTLNRIMETKTNLLQMKKGVTCRLSLAVLMSFEEQRQY